MNEISIKQIQQIGEYWLVYTKETGKTAHIQLSACANNFAVIRGDAGGERKCVGLRYEKDGYGCYELFNVGHTQIRCPLKPGLLGGKRAVARLRAAYENIEAQLNSYGWYTMAE